MMYRVIVGRKAYQFTEIIEVEAEDVEAAEVKAKAMAREDETLWREASEAMDEEYFIEDLESRPDLNPSAA